MEPSGLRVARSAQERRRSCLGGWLPTCLGKARVGEAAQREAAKLSQAEERERKGSGSGSQPRMAAGCAQSGYPEQARKGPRGRHRLGDGRHFYEREEDVDDWLRYQGGHVPGMSVETRSCLSGVLEGGDVRRHHRDLLAGQSFAGCSSERKRFAREEELRCSQVLEKVKAMRSQLGEDLKKNNVVFRASQLSKDGIRVSSEAEAFCQTLLSSFAREPEIPKDLEVMIKDCFKSCIGVHNKECMVCTRDFTAKDLLTCKTSNRCRHSLYPCGHSVLCGDCAEILWRTTKKCPMCRTLMTKRPKVFKPGRWQMIGHQKE